MNFTIDCNLPVSVGKPVDYYRDRVKNLKITGSGAFEGFGGEISIEDEDRYISGSIRDGRVIDIELTWLEPHDTFEGVPVSLRPKKFAKQLTKCGFPSSVDDDGVVLADHPVSMYVEEREVASICWGIDG